MTAPTLQDRSDRLLGPLTGTASVWALELGPAPRAVHLATLLPDPDHPAYPHAVIHGRK